MHSYFLCITTVENIFTSRYLKKKIKYKLHQSIIQIVSMETTEYMLRKKNIIARSCQWISCKVSYFSYWVADVFGFPVIIFYSTRNGLLFKQWVEKWHPLLQGSPYYTYYIMLFWYSTLERRTFLIFDSQPLSFSQKCHADDTGKLFQCLIPHHGVYKTLQFQPSHYF